MGVLESLRGLRYDDFERVDSPAEARFGKAMSFCRLGDRMSTEFAMMT